jgi:protein SCO1/2
MSPLIARLPALLVLLTALSRSMAGALPSDSLYQLHVNLQTSAGRPAALDLYRGQPTLLAMFYGSCTAACPMLITGMQVYESRLPPESRARLRVLLVSFDAARDTPAQMTQLAHEHRIDLSRWTVAAAPKGDARRLAALLGVHYRQLPNGEFEHSLLITLVDRDGRVVASTATVVGDDAFQARLGAAAADPGGLHPE